MRTLIVAAMAAGCAMSCRSTEKGAEEASRHGQARAGAEPGRLPRCGEPAPMVPRLESYLALQIPATCWVDMILDGGEWRPVAHILMAPHHATRLELTNATDFPALAHHQGELLRFTVELTSQEIHQVSGRSEWRATYHARIIAVCIPDQR